MHLSIHNRSLLRGMVAGAVALAGVSACSHSDRASAGRDTAQTGAVAQADTQASTSNQLGDSTQPTTSTQSSTDTTMGAPSADNSKASSEKAKAAHHTWRARSTGARAAAPDSGDQGVAGYKAMGSDSSTASGNVSDTTQVSAATSQLADTSSSAAVSDTSAADTPNAGAAPMARDTSVALAQGDTAVQADTATIGDTAVILARPDTSKTAVAMGNESDTTAAAADTAAVANDSAAAERIHADTVSQKAAELAKHEPARVRTPADSTADAAAVGAAGVASTGNIATGAEAVAQMSSQGERCSVVASDEHRDVQWDMASSPATLNPCGTGTMTLPKIWTGEKK